MDLTYLMRVYICDTLDEIQMIWNVSSVENTNTGGRPKGRNPVLYCIEEEFHSHIYAYAKVYRFYGGSECHWVIDSYAYPVRKCIQKYIWVYILGEMNRTWCQKSVSMAVNDPVCFLSCIAMYCIAFIISPSPSAELDANDITQFFRVHWIECYIYIWIHSRICIASVESI